MNHDNQLNHEQSSTVDPMNNPDYPILIVDDEENTLRSMRLVLKSEGYSNIVTESDSRKVLSRLSKDPLVSAIMLDLSMPYLTGHELLEQIKTNYSHIPVLIITGSNNLETAVDCMRKGAFDYIVKPVDKNRLLSSLRIALEFSELQSMNHNLKEHLFKRALDYPEAFEEIVTQDDRMFQLFKYIESVGKSTQPVLVTGETGVGKELFARAIHRLSQRKGEFVSINVAGLDDAMVSDSLFGHTKGAFTGAINARKGLVETAANGTLFLDEIGDMPIQSQVKLLRLLQEKEYYPVGADRPSRSNARIIVATHRDLRELQKENAFRTDLFYRLRTHHIHVPPLRERLRDIPLLADYFAEIAAKQLNRNPPLIPLATARYLQKYHFPGNIRELEGLVYDAVSNCQTNELTSQSFESRLNLDEGTGKTPMPFNPSQLLEFNDRLPTLKEADWLLVTEAMERANFNQTIASRLLGITQQALSKRIKNMEEIHGAPMLRRKSPNSQ
ncbi:MAG: sigma-54-dependent transcriptional regulator [Sumerlaeia bacterium]